jgi:pimeloyl-ACP methyl ester carboxylesterase
MQDRPWIVATPEMMAGSSTPTLVLHGVDDKLIPVEAGRKFAATIPGARLIVYPDAGHTPQMEIPARSVADLQAFLERSQGAPTTSGSPQAAGPSPSSPSAPAGA